MPRRIVRAVRGRVRRYTPELALSLADAIRRPRPAARLAVDPFPGDGALAAVWLGHASVMLRLGGVVLLTDPVLSARIGPRVGRAVLGPSRRSPAPILEPGAAGVILVSHAHYDHLDRPSLARIASPGTVVVTARHTGRFIPRGFGDVIELDWDRSLSVGGVEVAALQPRHWGARRVFDRRRGYNSYALAAGGRRVLYAGDTGQTSAFDRLPAADLSIFGIGAYDPSDRAHATPEQVWAMFTRSGGRVLLPVHHSTFRMGDEPMDDPLRRLLAAAGSDRRSIAALPPGRLWTPGPD